MKTHYSCAELAEMQLPGMPRNRQNWHELVKREGWGFVELKGKDVEERAAAQTLIDSASQEALSIVAQREADKAEAARIAAEEEAEKRAAEKLLIDQQAQFPV